MTSNVVQAEPKFDVVGKRPIRHDGYDKVTGRATYGADINLPGLLYGAILRSPHAHARTVSVDTRKAEAHPEVKAVATSRDLPQEQEDKPVVLITGSAVNLHHLTRNVLAREKALYKGHAIAAVAATSAHAAEEALSLIDVKYEILPAVTNVEDAMKPDAPRLHDKFEGNVANQVQLSIGDVKRGFGEADVIVEREYRTKTVHQGYIEPHTATAWWRPDDKLTLWVSTQGHFTIRERTGAVIGLPSSRIKVIPMEIGGGFGGKTTVYVESVAAVLSRKSGKPVKITMSRADVLEATGPTSGSYMKVKIGATNEGRLTAAQASLMYEAGAFPGSPFTAAARCIFSVYDIENVQIDAYDIVDNKPKTTAYRAPGVPGATFAAETVVDEICEKISIDPPEFRLLNGAREGTRRATGVINPRIGCIETVEAARGHDHYSTLLLGPNRGRGVATGFWINGTGHACATASVNADGTVNLVIGSVDLGGLRTVAAQQFAEVLGMDAEDVNPQVGDTDSIGWTSLTSGSGAAFKTGWASHDAAQDVKRQLIERAAQLWEAPPEEVLLAGGMIQHRSDPELKMSLKELAGRIPETGGPVVGRANMHPRGAGSSFATHIADVEVDRETGKVTILRYTAVQDAGKAIHPGYVEGQIQGGVVQGIGWALTEEYYMGEDGRMLNASLLDYRMPTALDLPMIDAVIVEVPNPVHPYGVRGVGEIAIVPPLAAVANAIYHAIGVRMTSLPMNPASIVKALSESDGK